MWYPGAHPITSLYLPVPDPTKPWASTGGTTCKEGKSTGHLNTVLADTTSKDSLQDVAYQTIRIIANKLILNYTAKQNSVTSTIVHTYVFSTVQSSS